MRNDWRRVRYRNRNQEANMKESLIRVAVNCPVSTGIDPLGRGNKNDAVHIIQYEILKAHPYMLDKDTFYELVYLLRLPTRSRKIKSYSLARNVLPKRYGWGIHINKVGKLALVDCSGKKYKKLEKSRKVKKIRASKNSGIARPSQKEMP